ncbi:MAG TPA: MFS transporter [Pseudolabrys sp.]|nr:MFS transporter [Pseudolabrys sp.]
MSQASQIIGTRRTGDARVIGLVSAAHFVSHIYILVLPPLFAFVRADYGVSYTELGIALAAYNVVSAAFQTPAGFLVDWLGARILLIGGLVLGAVAFAIAGLVDSFWVLVAMFAVVGLANTTFHPADYALLSHHVSASRISRAFSVHTFAGMLGSAVAPGSLLLMQNQWGWRGAFIGTAVLGVVVAAILALQREDQPAHTPETKPRAAEAGTPAGWRLLMAPAILLNMVFFIVLALISGGINNYSIVALSALYGTPPVTANAALSAYLLLSAVGVLIGGAVATYTTRHGLVTAFGLLATAIATLLIANFDFRPFLLILVMSVGGFFSGAIMPSRDMIVREATPPGSFGKVFGFVSTGFNIGGVVSPLIFGALMDHGSPRWVFLLVAAFNLIAIATVVTRPARRD